jgi:hypothetical protein
MLLPYINISGKFLLRKDFSLTEKIFLSVLGVVTRKGRQGTSVSNIWLSEVCNTSTVYISRMLKKFIEQGILNSGRKYGNREITFTMNREQHELWADLFYNFEKEIKKVK